MDWIDNVITLASAVFYAYLSLVAGGVMLQALKLGSMERSSRIACSLLLGYGVFAVLGFFLALSGFFTQWILWFFVVILLAATRKRIIAHTVRAKNFFKTN